MAGAIRNRLGRDVLPGNQGEGPKDTNNSVLSRKQQVLPRRSVSVPVGPRAIRCIVLVLFAVVIVFNLEFEDDSVAGRLIKKLEMSLIDRALPGSFCLNPDHPLPDNSTKESSSLGQKFYTIRNLTASCGLGGDSLLPNEDFRRDTVRLKNILTANYAHSSSCPRITLEHLAINELQHYESYYAYSKVPCFGIGTTIGWLAQWFTEFMLKGTIVEIDAYTCDVWFKNDMAHPCEKLFDCYIPSLFLPLNPTGESLPANSSLLCESITWFQDKWGWDILRMAGLSWMLGHDPQHPQQKSLAQFIGLDEQIQQQEPCLALHVRRGDACANPRRYCFGYEQYLRAALDMKKVHNLDALVLLTDAHDFPHEIFNASFEVTASTEDKRKYDVSHLLNSTKKYAYFPENREHELFNSTSQVFQDIALGSSCDAFVGTFSASLSKLVYSLIVVRHAYVSPFISLQGCPGHIQQFDQFRNSDTCKHESHW